MFNFVKLLLTEEPWDDEPIAIQIIFIEKKFVVHQMYDWIK